MLQNAEMGAAMARAMKHDQDAFDIDNFITELISFMGGTIDGSVEDGDADGDLDWNLLGRKCYPFSRRAPALDFMLGPLSIEVKQRKKVVRSKLAKNKEDEVHPQELRADEIQRSENETSKMVKVVHRVSVQILFSLGSCWPPDYSISAKPRTTAYPSSNL